MADTSATDFGGPDLSFPATVLAYPPGEDYTDALHTALYNAFVDPELLEPTGPNGANTDLLFPANVFSFKPGGDATITGSNGTIQLPIAGIVVTIGFAYGFEHRYAGDTAVDVLGWVPFTVWANTGSDRDDADRRVQFMRGHRTNVLEKHGLTLFGGSVLGRPRDPSPITGLECVDYKWRCLYSFP